MADCRSLIEFLRAFERRRRAGCSMGASSLYMHLIVSH
jgi:hypothetical protein